MFPTGVKITQKKFAASIGLPNQKKPKLQQRQEDDRIGKLVLTLSLV